MPLVSQYMNAHLVYLRAGDRTDIALGPILEFGLTSIPVLDEDHRPVGMVSLRQLAGSREATPHATSDAKTVSATENVDIAARLMAQENRHHLVVVDTTGVAVGMLSSLDVLRALVGLPPEHPVSTRRFALQADGDIQSEYVR